MDPKERLNQVLSDIRELDAKGVLEHADAIRMGELITEGKNLRSQLEMKGDAADLVGFAGQSAGMLPLTGATVQSIRPTLPEEVQNPPSGMRANSGYGEGSHDDAVRNVISREDYRKAFTSYLRTGIGRQVPSEALRTLSEGGDVSGGFLVPEDFLNQVIVRDPTPTRVQGLVTSLTTSRDMLTVPKVVYTTDDLYSTGIRTTWTGEIPAASTTARVTDPTFGQARIPIYTNMMSIPVTNDMIEDTSFPLVSWLSDKFRETIDLLKDNMILNGTGIGQPSGILPFSSTANTDANLVKGLKSGSATIGTDMSKFLSVAFDLPEQYDMNARWVFNKVSTAQALAKIVDANGRPFWTFGAQDYGYAGGMLGNPLLGYPVVLSGFMPNVASGAKVAVFGDLRGYYLVNRIGFSIQILRELYAETNQILILGRIRFGGMVAEPFKLRTMEASA